MPNPDPTPFRYRDATGARHQVVVRRNAAGAWRVLDILVVETLSGAGEGREAAEAIARDYAEQHDHPNPRIGPRAAEPRAA